MANGPTKTDADEILAGNGALVVPNIQVNAGGATVSHFEWIQNRTGLYWSEDEVHERLERIMTREFIAIHEMITERRFDMRTVADAHALNRISQAREPQATSSYLSASRSSG